MRRWLYYAVSSYFVTNPILSALILGCSTADLIYHCETVLRQQGSLPALFNAYIAGKAVVTATLLYRGS